MNLHREIILDPAAYRERQARLIRLGAIPRPSLTATRRSPKPNVPNAVFKTAWRLLDSFCIERSEDDIPTIKEIRHAVCAHYNMSLVDLIASRRTRAVVRPRQVAYYLAKTHTGASLPMIGREFAGKDHTTILHGVRLISKLIETDPKIRADVRSIETDLGLR